MEWDAHSPSASSCVVARDPVINSSGEKDALEMKGMDGPPPPKL